MKKWHPPTRADWYPDEATIERRRQGESATLDEMIQALPGEVTIAKVKDPRHA